jgi:hypothetical protein
VIGVWCQPTSSFALWKARGINTLVGYEPEGNRTSMDDWTGAAVASSLFMIRKPHPNIQDDVVEPYLLAWMHGDEPDIKKPPEDPAHLAEDAADWKKADPTRPIFVNFSGGNVLYHKVPEKTYREYCKSADWIGNDFYPVTGWNQPKLIPKVGQILDMLRDWSGGKPQFAFIETSPQHLSWLPPGTPGVTAAQFRAEVWDSIIHGARGIIYFPQQIGNGFKYDNTPADVAIEMTTQDQLLSDLDAVLKTPANPGGLGAAATSPIETAWRKTADGTVYIFALNLSPDVQNGQSIKLTGIQGQSATVFNEDARALTITNSTLTDDFRPFQIHVYAIKVK